VAGAPTSVDTAPPGALQYPNRRWVRHAALRGGLERRCGCECQPHQTLSGRLCAGARGVIYGLAYHCDVCDDDLCLACYDAGYDHHQHRRSHVLVEIPPPPPSLQSLPDQKPLSEPPPSPRSIHLRCGVNCITYDSYETDVYNDARDCLVYYHWTEPSSTSLQLSRIVEQVQAEVQQRPGVDAQHIRWSGADEYARRVYGHELDVVANAYLPWLVEQLTGREGELQHLPLLGAMDVNVNAVD